MNRRHRKRTETAAVAAADAANAAAADDAASSAPAMLQQLQHSEQIHVDGILNSAGDRYSCVRVITFCYGSEFTPAVQKNNRLSEDILCFQIPLKSIQRSALRESVHPVSIICN